MPQYHTVSFEEIRYKHYCIDQTSDKRQVVSHSVTAVKDMGKATVTLSFGSSLSQRKFTCSSPASLHLPYKSDIITSIVGTENVKNFMIHRAAVVCSSGFVHDAMKEGWKTAEQRIISLPDDMPDVFGIYQTWLYKHCIPTDDTSETGYETLVRAYILGDKLRDVAFKDVIIDCIMERLRSTKPFDLRLTNLVYNNTRGGSSLRRLWCDMYAMLGSASWLDDCCLEGPSTQIY